VIVELPGCDWILLCDLEEVEICVESELERSVCRIGGIAVAVLLQVGRESMDASCESTCPAPGELSSAFEWTMSCIYIHKGEAVAVFLRAQGYREAGTTVQIRTSFHNYAHCSQMLE